MMDVATAHEDKDKDTTDVAATRKAEDMTLWAF
jgi:hypothetical protein